MTNPPPRKSTRSANADAAGPSPTSLSVLCAGAAQGFVQAMESRFTAQAGVSIATRFGAVGALREALLAGEACDVLIVTDLMVRGLISTGRLRTDSRVVLGQVRTGMAVRADQPAPDISTGESLRDALLAARGIHFPDPTRATAGVHFADVMLRLGVQTEVAARCHTYPNGAAAMRALAASSGPAQVGCTQISEIIFTPGLRLIGALPAGYELATAYAAAVSQGCAHPQIAEAFNALLGAPEFASERIRCGIEPQPVGA